MVEEKQEELQEFINRIPTKFGFVVTIYVITIFIVALALSIVVNYSDVLNGSITIKKGTLPIKVVTKGSGNLKLLISLKNPPKVKKGEYLAFFENPTNVTFIKSLKQTLENFSSSKSYSELSRGLTNFSQTSGDLTSKVTALKSAAEKIILYSHSNIYSEQGRGFLQSLSEQSNIIKNLRSEISMRKSNQLNSHSIYSRDSNLFARQLISKLDYEKSLQNYLNFQESSISLDKELVEQNRKQNDIKGQISVARIQNFDKADDMRLQFVAAYNDVIENIKDWEQKYVVMSPSDGRLVILKFVEDNEFVKSGEELFAVVSGNSTLTSGIVEIGNDGYGKLKIGQKVVVKLRDFPYKEFGSVNGYISSIASTSKTVTSGEKSAVTESYIITVTFKADNISSFGKKLKMQSGQKGVAEIVTAKRNLFQRIFYSLNYSLQ